MAAMWIDSAPQPCPRCSRSTVLATWRWRRQWVHVGTWRPECGRTAEPAVPGGTLVGASR
jgi:ribosomal protein S27AE